MDKYEIRILIMTGLLLSIFLIAVLRGLGNDATEVPGCIPYDEAFTQPGIKQIDDNVYQVYMQAQMWSFEPSEIYLPVGAELDIYLSSKDVVHGFNIAGKVVNMMAVPGGINRISAKFDKPGVYPIVCHEYCGSGHQQMYGEIIVNYPNKK